MRGIGFRIEPRMINWAVVEGSPQSPVLVACDAIAPPRTFGEGQSLVWCRTQVRTFIDAYRPERAWIRYPEHSARPSRSTGVHTRARMEGVIIESAHSKGLRVMTGALNSISAKLGTASAKAYLGSSALLGLDWSKFSDNRREAILAAVASLGD